MFCYVKFLRMYNQTITSILNSIDLNYFKFMTAQKQSRFMKLTYSFSNQTKSILLWDVFKQNILNLLTLIFTLVEKDDSRCDGS